MEDIIKSEIQKMGRRITSHRHILKCIKVICFGLNISGIFTLTIDGLLLVFNLYFRYRLSHDDQQRNFEKSTLLRNLKNGRDCSLL